MPGSLTLNSSNTRRGGWVGGLGELTAFVVSSPSKRRRACWVAIRHALHVRRQTIRERGKVFTAIHRPSSCLCPAINDDTAVKSDKSIVCRVLCQASGDGRTCSFACGLMSKVLTPDP